MHSYQVWWKQVLNYFDSNLLVNNSYRGTTVYGNDSTSGYMSRGENLHNNIV